MNDDIVLTGPWVKSSLSFSNGNCVELAAWRASSRSTFNGNCVEAGSCRHGVAVRDTKDRGGPVLLVGAMAWREFSARLKAGTLAP